ncbi:MAG: phosphate ABC transporter permease PstA [bacterium]
MNASQAGQGAADSSPTSPSTSSPDSQQAARDLDQLLRRGIRARYRKERRFRRFGAVSIAVGVLFLLWLLAVSAFQASSAFHQTYIALDIHLDAAQFGDSRSHEAIAGARYGKIIKATLRAEFADADTRKAKKELYKLVSDGAQYALRDAVLRDPSWIGERRRIWVLAGGQVDLLTKGHIKREQPAATRRLSDRALGWIDQLHADGRIEKRFNRPLFTAGDSRNAEEAGILGAMVGSLLTMLATMLLALPVGIAAAVYLQEFAPKSKLVDLVEVNINNLAAVPSIIFGLLGLAVLINFFGFARSAPLVGGMVLALMTLPTIIISSRAALASVPPRIRQAALGVGASGVQCVIHHVLPLAMPGMLTGAIIGLARALGETAPLLAIGMVAFIVDVPGGMNDPATVLPVQIYLWADSPERGFVERTAAAIIVLLVVLVAINGLVALLRNKLEKRW